jgi:hypothetical protein
MLPNTNYIGTNKNLIINPDAARTPKMCWQGPAETFCYAMSVLPRAAQTDALLCEVQWGLGRETKICVIGNVRNNCWQGPEQIHWYATLCSGESWDRKYGSWAARALKPGITVLVRTSCNLPDRQGPRRSSLRFQSSGTKYGHEFCGITYEEWLCYWRSAANWQTRTVSQESRISSHVLSSDGRRLRFKRLGMNKDFVISPDGTQHQE